MTRAVVIGQSHCNAIADALDGDPRHAHEITVHRIGDPNFGANGEPFTFGAGIPMVAALAPGTPVFLSMLGGYHNVLGLFQSGQRYDFLLDPKDRAEPPPTARVPNRAIASVLEEVFGQATKILKMKSVSKAPVYLLSTPPPKQSNEFIMSRVLAQKKVHNGQRVAEVEVERPEIRLKLWQLEAGLLERWAKRGGMHYVPAPPEAFDDNGFLGREFYNDATHANAQYGALVVRQIEAIIAGKEIYD